MHARTRNAVLLLTLVPLLAPLGALAHEGPRGETPCIECHKLTKKEVETALNGLVDKVVGVRESKVPGLFAVDVEKQSKTIPVYMDFSKKYLITGDVIDLSTRQSLTRERYVELNRVDVSRIPLDDALVIGDPKAPEKIVVFDDPECPFCVKLQPEMQKVVEKREDVAFFIKMFPLKIHPHARKKAEAIVCAKSLKMLEDSLAGKPVPEPTCKTDQIDKNEALGAELGVRSTPTLIFPDGRVIPGYKPADQILSLLAEDKTIAGDKQ